MKPKENLLNARYTFVTAGGLITGLVTSIEQDKINQIIELENVVICSTHCQEKIDVPVCELKSDQIIALIPALNS